MAGENTRTTLDGIYKVVYPSGTENLVPEQTPLQGSIDFDEQNSLGEEYHKSVTLTLPAGVTYGGQDGSAYSLIGTVAGETKKAKIKGSQITVQEAISYGAAKAARGGKESFKDAVGHIFEAASMVFHRRFELSMMHGQSATGLGVVESVASLTVTFTEASWAPGAWIGAKGGLISFWAAGFGTLRVDTTITSVDLENRKITVGAVTGVVATDLILYRGQRKDTSTWNDNIGMIPAIDTSGSIFSIDSSLYDTWKGNEKDFLAGDASFDLISALLSDMFVKGANGEMVCWVSPKTWTNLISPEVAVRRHDSNYKPEKVTVGHDAIEFRHMTGKLSIKAHAMMKRSELMVVAPKLWKRVGSTQFSFEQDTGSNVRKIFLHLAGANGFEIRGYADMAPFTKRLGVAGYGFNIVNSN